MEDIELARGWAISLVRKYLETESSKNDLVDFIRARYAERFFNPIHELRRATSDEHRYGFAIMALCSLLIETIQCYYDGLPSTYRRELEDIDDKIKKGILVVDTKYVINQGQWVTLAGGPRAFTKFFRNNRQFFPDNLNGEEFYGSIRCGLLHQAQTKNGWKIRRSGPLWDEDLKSKSLNRDLFSEKLEESFCFYLDKLKTLAWDDNSWKLARQKIWWVAKLSEPSI